MDLSKEIVFQTARSGGKGGQHVNKVETAVLASFHVQNSTLFSDTQKQLIAQKLANRINSNGFLQVKSQMHRTQLKNKEDAVNKMTVLLTNALHTKKLRKATTASRASVERRLAQKRRNSDLKKSRSSFSRNDD